MARPSPRPITLGELSSTYRSTARLDDPVSGIRVFRVPVGALFRGVIKFTELGIGDIEIIQPHHRHVTAWPSIHPTTGQRYRWFAPDGTLLPEGVVPRVEDLPALPPEWVEALSRDAVREEVFDGSAPNRTRAQRDRINEELYQKLIRRDDNRAPERLVAERLDRALSELTSGSSGRYDTTRDHVAALMRLWALGRAGVPSALEQLYSAYVMEVADTRPQAVAESEFLRFTEGAAALVAASMPHHEQADTAGSRANADNASQDDERQRAPSWGAVDLTDLLQGVHEPLLPTLFQRSDDHCLLYPGMVHSFHGESESGKSLIVQAECVRLLKQGHNVLYVDFDSDELQWWAASSSSVPTRRRSLNTSTTVAPSGSRMRRRSVRRGTRWFFVPMLWR